MGSRESQIPELCALLTQICLSEVARISGSGLELLSVGHHGSQHGVGLGSADSHELA